jgi:hypothetical protein
MNYTYKEFDGVKDVKIKENQKTLYQWSSTLGVGADDTGNKWTDSSISSWIQHSWIYKDDTAVLSAADNSVAAGSITNGDLYNYIATKFYNVSTLSDGIPKVDGVTTTLSAYVLMLDSDLFLDKVNIAGTSATIDSSLYALSAVANSGDDPNTAMITLAGANVGTAFLDYGLFVFTESSMPYATGITAATTAISMTSNSVEYQTSYVYFCRAYMDEFNYSLNSTYTVTADSHVGTYRVRDEFATDSKTYISGVGLYNQENQLLAVAKTNVPRLKDDENETLFRIKVIL